MAVPDPPEDPPEPPDPLDPVEGLPEGLPVAKAFISEYIFTPAESMYEPITSTMTDTPARRRSDSMDT